MGQASAGCESSVSAGHLARWLAILCQGRLVVYTWMSLDELTLVVLMLFLLIVFALATAAQDSEPLSAPELENLRTMKSEKLQHYHLIRACQCKMCSQHCQHSKLHSEQSKCQPAHRVVMHLECHWLHCAQTLFGAPRR